MSNWIRVTVMSCLTSALMIACAGEPETAVPASEPQAAMYDEGAARFVSDAVQRDAGETSYRYAVTSPAGESRELVIGVSSPSLARIPDLAITSETGFTWCEAETPSVPVSKSIWCQACNRNDAEDCARQWAFTTARNYCDTQISESDGDAACAPESFTDSLCVRTSSQGITSSVQVGSDTACGTWPLRHAAWKVTYNVTGNCGYSCRS